MVAEAEPGAQPCWQRTEEIPQHTHFWLLGSGTRFPSIPSGPCCRPTAAGAPFRTHHPSHAVEGWHGEGTHPGHTPTPTSTRLGLAPLPWCLSPRAPSSLPGLSSSYSSAPGSPPQVVSASCCLRHLSHFHILLLLSPYVPGPPWQCCPMAKAFFRAFLPCSRKEIKSSPRPSGCVCRDHGHRPSPRAGLRPNSSTLSQNF